MGLRWAASGWLVRVGAAAVMAAGTMLAAGGPAHATVSALGVVTGTDASSVGPGGLFVSATLVGTLPISGAAGIADATFNTTLNCCQRPPFVTPASGSLSGTSASGSIDDTCAGQATIDFPNLAPAPLQPLLALVFEPQVTDINVTVTCDGALTGPFTLNFDVREVPTILTVYGVLAGMYTASG
jgi:hypothetical protein